jgi:hypothetical protein
MMSVSAGAAIYSLAAVAVAVGLVVALHVVEPEFDPSWRMLSEYSLGRYGVLMRVAFLAGGTSVIAVAVALSGSAWPGSVGLVLAALGPLGAAFVDTDPVTTPRTQMSRRSNVHAGLGALFILGFPVAATVAGVVASGDPAVGQILAWASLVPWIGLAWFLAATIRHARPDGRGAPEVRIGWPNRMSMLTYLGWVALAAVLTLT